MTERERLIELIDNGLDKYRVEPLINGCRESFDIFIAGYLLANGVIVPPCKVGDYVHFEGLEEQWRVSTINFYEEGKPQISITSKTGKITTTMTFDEFSEFAVVLTREEAEKALEGKT
jgi:hypothetical protein